MAATKTIAGPDAQFIVYDKYKPMNEATAPKHDDKNSMFTKRFVHRKAVAAGVINMATTRIIPTVCKAETVTNVKTIINP